MSVCVSMCVCVNLDKLILFMYFLIFKLFLLYFSLPLIPLIPPFPYYYHTFVHIHESFFLLAPSFHLLTFHPLPTEQSACFLSMSLFLFCLVILFVHQIPHLSEILWYLSFSYWLISLSIMFSRSVHTVTKGKIFFSFMAK